MKKVKDVEILIKYCEPVSDDDGELRNCPFEYEYEDSPESSPSAAVTPSEPTGILMLSVPSTTDSDGQSSAHENEEFETPPEQNNSSQPYFSGSDEQKPSTSAGVDATEAVDLGNDDDDLGFSNRREIDGCDIGEFEEQLRKRYRISEDLDVKKEAIVIEIDQTQTQGVDTEVVECAKNVEVCDRGIERNADHSTVKMCERDGGEMRENGERGVDDNENEKLNGVGDGDSDGERGVVSMNFDENEELIGVSAKEMHSNGITRSVGDGDGERGVVSMNFDENEKLNGVSAKEMHSNGITRSVGDGDGERGVVSMNFDENEELIGVSAKEMHSNGITRSVGDGDGEKGVVSMNFDENEKLNGVSAKEMHSNGITRSVGDGERGVVSMNFDENEKLNGVNAKEMHSNRITRSVGDSDGGGGGSGVKERRELPLSIRGEDKNVGSLEEVGRRAIENGRFNDLVEAFSMVAGDASGDDRNATDFLETSKRRGLSFPRPRWWPPEGFAD